MECIQVATKSGERVTLLMHILQHEQTLSFSWSPSAGAACHTVVQGKDVVFTEYAKR